MPGAKTLPISSAEILAAQAESGQAGVEAYESAQNDLKQSKAEAVRLAQAEAASRGAPAGAAGGVGAGVARAYDERLGSLRQGQAAAGDAAASRKGRMADYNANVLAARSLIGDQAAKAVAPINAESEYKIRALERSGQNAVDRINAQLNLEMAKAEAAARAAAARRSSGGGGGGGGGSSTTKRKTPAKDELQGLLGQYGPQALSAALEQASGAISSTREREADAAREVRAAAEKPTGVRTNSQNRFLEINGVDPSTMSGGPGLAALRAAVAATSDDLRRVGGMPGDISTGSYVVDQAMAQGRSAAPISTGSYVVDQAMAQGAPTGGNETAARRAWEQLLAASKDRDAQVKAVAPHLFDVPNNPMLFGAPEIEQMMGSPFAPIFEPAIASGQRIRTDEDLYRLMGGEGISPTDNAIPAETMERAMLVAAQQLNESGYNISEADFLAAMEVDRLYEPGSTAADVYGKRSGVTSALETADAAARQAAMDARQAITDERSDIDNEFQSIVRQRQVDRWATDDAFQVYEDDAREANYIDSEVARGASADEARFKAKTGIPVPTGAASPAAALEVYESARFKTLADNLKEAGYQPGFDSIGTYYEQIGADPLNPTDRLVLDMLEAMLG